MGIEYDRRRDDDGVQIPRSINVGIEPGFISFTRENRVICKFARLDNDAMFNAVTLLNGIVNAGLLPAEIEQLRDLLQEVVGS